MQISRAEIETYLREYKPYHPAGDENKYWLAVCHVRLGQHAEANALFQAALDAMLGPEPFWQRICSPDIFVHCFVLSARMDLLPAMMDTLAAFRDQDNHRVGYSPLACYAYALMEALQPSGADLAWFLEGALRRPNFRDVYAAARAVDAILQRDQAALDEALDETVRAHERQIKQGGLQLAGLPFKLLAVDAMALACVAHRQGLAAAPLSDYFAADYLEFIELDR